MTVPAKGIEADLDVNAILARQRDDVVSCSDPAATFTTGWLDV
jgi:hypothetical protein